jgi:hypothetical protein
MELIPFLHQPPSQAHPPEQNPLTGSIDNIFSLCPQKTEERMKRQNQKDKEYQYRSVQRSHRNPIAWIWYLKVDGFDISF